MACKRGAWQAAFYLVRNLFQGYSDIINDFGDSKVLYFHQTLKKVQREGHRMKAFVRFSKSNDGLFFSLIAPDFNVLPLIVSFFKNRYADQVWLLYDVKRTYGFYYDKKIVTEVKVTDQSIVSNVLTEKTIDLDENDIKIAKSLEASITEKWNEETTISDVVLHR